jgi:nucleotide-binding universal stress UspA family protein
MTTTRILLPINFRPQDEKALDFVIRTFGRNPEAEVTLFNGYTPPPAIETSRSTVMKSIQDNLSYLHQQIRERERHLEAAVGRLTEGGLSPGRVDVVFQPRKGGVAEDIADLARSRKCDVVVLNRKPGKVSRFFTGSTHHRVLSALENTTVCIVS